MGTLFDPAEAEGGAAKRRVLIVETDGGSRGNPGHAGYGALVRDPASGAIVAEQAGYLGIVSNNVAEYSGLVAGLQLALAQDPEALIHVKMDSKLVVEQMSGRWKIKHEDMRSLATKARSIVDPRRVKYEWIPREINKDADRLSNEAMDAGQAGVDWQPAISPAPSTSPMPVIVERDPEPYAPPAQTGAITSVPQYADTMPYAQMGQAQAPLVAEPAPAMPTGRLHHIELWVEDFAAARVSLGWMLESLGYERRDEWDSGASWQGAVGYIVLESGPDVVPGPHERRRPGLNHLAFWAGPPAAVDAIVADAPNHGWTLMYQDRHPYAGGSGHYAAYLENAAGFEVELVATTELA